MHGFFIDTELYDKVNLIANPNSYQDQREREIRKRIEKERESRIRSTGAITNTKIKVNKDLASKLQDKKGSTDAETVINDDRFKEMFENPEFAIDEQSHEYKQLNPVKSTKDVSAPALTAAEESDEERLNLNNGVSDHESNSDDSDSESESEDEETRKLHNQRVQKEMEKLRRKKEAQEESNRFMNKMKVMTEDNTKQKGVESFGSQLLKNNKIQKPKTFNNDSRLRRHARGEAELTFVPHKLEKKPKVRFESDNSEDPESTKNSGRTKQRFDGRRRASKNAFRGM